MTEIRCIAIGTGAGEAPGLNALIRTVVKSAILKYNWKVIGIPDGFDGLIWPERAFELTLKSVNGILPRGGTILGTTNRGNPFKYRKLENGVEVVRDIAAGGFGKTVCLKGEHIRAVDIADAVGQMKAIDPRGGIVAAARAIGICVGDERLPTPSRAGVLRKRFGRAILEASL